MELCLPGYAKLAFAASPFRSAITRTVYILLTNLEGKMKLAKSVFCALVWCIVSPNQFCTGETFSKEDRAIHIDGHFVNKRAANPICTVQQSVHQQSSATDDDVKVVSRCFLNLSDGFKDGLFAFYTLTGVIMEKRHSRHLDSIV